MMRGFAWMLLFSVLPACAVNTGTSMRPMDWSLAPLVDTNDSPPCPMPVGLFSNQGESSDPDVTPLPLAHLLFPDQLRGYPVEAVRLAASPGSETLLATGVLAGVPLQEQRKILPAGEDCRHRWQIRGDSGAVDSQVRTEALLTTGGLVLPLGEVYEISLELADDGALLVNVKWKAWMLGALVFPVRLDRQVWMRFSVHPASAALDEQ